MDSTLLFYLILGGLVIGFIVFTLLKGLIKMILFGAAVLCSIGTYFWIAKYGFTYLSFITANPRDWMVTTLAVLLAVGVFTVFMHGIKWFGNVFSWGSKMGFGGVKGIVTTILMALVVCWVGVMCIYYYGSMAEMNRVKELAQYHMDSTKSISNPIIYTLKKSITDNPNISWLGKLSPEHEPERLALAKIIAYLGALNPQLSEVRRAQLDSFMPRSRITSRTLSLKTLSQDAAMRQLVEKGDMQGLYNDVKLTRFLQDEDVRRVLSQLDVDRVLGFATPTRQQEEIPYAEPVQ